MAHSAFLRRLSARLAVEDNNCWRNSGTEFVLSQEDERVVCHSHTSSEKTKTKSKSSCGRTLRRFGFHSRGGRWSHKSLAFTKATCASDLVLAEIEAVGKQKQKKGDEAAAEAAAAGATDGAAASTPATAGTAGLTAGETPAAAVAGAPVQANTDPAATSAAVGALLALPGPNPRQKRRQKKLEGQKKKSMENTAKADNFFQARKAPLVVDPDKDGLGNMTPLDIGLLNIILAYMTAAPLARHLKPGQRRGIWLLENARDLAHMRETCKFWYHATTIATQNFSGLEPVQVKNHEDLYNNNNSSDDDKPRKPIPDIKVDWDAVLQRPLTVSFKVMTHAAFMRGSSRNGTKNTVAQRLAESFGVIGQPVVPAALLDETILFRRSLKMYGANKLVRGKRTRCMDVHGYW